MIILRHCWLWRCSSSISGLQERSRAEVESRWMSTVRGVLEGDTAWETSFLSPLLSQKRDDGRGWMPLPRQKVKIGGGGGEQKQKDNQFLITEKPLVSFCILIFFFVLKSVKIVCPYSASGNEPVTTPRRRQEGCLLPATPRCHLGLPCFTFDLSRLSCFPLGL